MPATRRSLLGALLAAPIALASSPASARRFTPPGPERRLTALGATDALPPDLRAAFAPGEDDRPIPSPGPDDWLAQHDEPGQSFARFVAERHNRPTRARRNLAMLPIGAIAGPGMPDLATLSDFAARFFQLPVAPVAATTMKALKADGRARRPSYQYDTRTILAALKKRVPGDAYAVIAVTLADLYPGPRWNFVFGHASFDERVGVYSFARFDPAFYGAAHVAGTPNKILRRALGLLAHEVGHMFGIAHCIYYHCLMNGCNHLDESDAAPLHLCPVCRRKLQYSANYDPALRARQLAAFYRGHGLVAEAARCERHLAAIVAAG